MTSTPPAQSGRGFSSLDLARIADLTGTDVRWLITGERDERVKITMCSLRPSVADLTDPDAGKAEGGLPG